MLLARGASHRTGADAEMIRWGAPFARVDGRREGDGRSADVDVTLVREGPSGGRKRIRVNGVPRRSGALAGVLRTVVFAPEEMLLVVGPPSLRRSALDALAAQRFPPYAADLFRVRPGPHPAQPPAARHPRRGGVPRPAPVLGREARRGGGGPAGGAPPPARGAGRPARGGPRRDRTGGGCPAAHLPDECPGRGRRGGRGGAGPAPARDGREGALERHHAWSDPTATTSPSCSGAASSPRSPRAAAADGNPGSQARRAGPPGGPRRRAAAPPPRRRLLGAGSGAPGASRAPDRDAAPGLRDDDDARGPGPRASAAGVAPWRVDGGEPPGPGSAGTGAGSSRRRHEPCPTLRRPPAAVAPSRRRIGDLLPEAALELGLVEQLRWARAGAAWDAVVADRVPTAAGGSRPGPPGGRRDPGRRGGGARDRAGAAHPGRGSPRGLRPATRRHPGRAAAGGGGQGYDPIAVGPASRFARRPDPGGRRHAGHLSSVV